MTRNHALRLVPLMLCAASPSGPGLFAQPVQATPPSPFARADADHDGKVTRAEFKAARQARFDSIDRNHDKQIDRRDFPGIANHQRALGALDQQIAAADTDHNGSVSREELSGALTPFFDRADSNHDGVVDTKEANAVRDAMARQSRPRN